MPRPAITSVSLLRLDRPAGRNTLPAALEVDLCTLAPAGAPVSVRPRYVSIALARSAGPSVTVAVRRGELAALTRALLVACRELGVEVDALPAPAVCEPA